jgi:glutamate carboxypeptidase
MIDMLARARGRTEAYVALLRELIEIESPSTDAAGVGFLAARIERELLDLGLHSARLPVDGGGPILYARSPGATSTRPIMLLGHLDTVWPLGTLASRPVRIEGDRLSGPGSYDMKAGIVIVIGALRLLAEKGPLPPVSIFLTPLEEVGCRPYRERLESEMRASRACLGFEPAGVGGAVKTARKGAGSFVLRSHGRGAHAGADFEKGANAIVELARRVLEASALTDLARGLTVNVGVIRGGIRPNVVPAEAEAELDVRYGTLREGEELEARLKGLRPETPGVTLELEGALGHPPLERTPAVAALFETARSVAQELGLVLEEVSVGGASEASFASVLGLPTLDGLGADGAGAHAEHEHVLIGSLAERAALTAALLERIARSSS